MNQKVNFKNAVYDFTNFYVTFGRSINNMYTILCKLLN